MIEILIIATVLIVGIIACELDSFVAGTLTLVAVLLAAQTWFGVAVWATFLAFPASVVAALVAYIALGLIYAVFVRYPRFLVGRQSDIDSAWQNYCKANPGPQYQDIEQFRASHHFKSFRAARNDQKIAAWAMLWPWGVAWDATNRPVRWIYNILADACTVFLERIERRAIDRAIKKGP